MTIVFDMDNTLTDEFGSTLRPGIVSLLKRLETEGHTLKLWTNSKRNRAVEILRTHVLMSFFVECVYRENYDPQELGLSKDIRKIKGDLLIDDDPNEIEYMKKIGRKGFLISSYRKGKPSDQSELLLFYQFIQKLAKKRKFR